MKKRTGGLGQLLFLLFTFTLTHSFLTAMKESPWGNSPTKDRKRRRTGNSSLNVIPMGDNSIPIDVAVNLLHFCNLNTILNMREINTAWREAVKRSSVARPLHITLSKDLIVKKQLDEFVKQLLDTKCFIALTISCAMGDDDFAKLNHLEHILFELNIIGFDDLITDKTLLTISKNHTLLKKLHLLQCNAITNDGLEHLCNTKHDLQEIGIYNCKEIGDRGMQLLGELPKLHIIEIGLTNLSNAGLRSFLEKKQRQQHKLQKLYLDGCHKIKPTIFRSFPEKLVCLSLINCSGLTKKKKPHDKSKINLSKFCYLEMLDLSRNYHLTDDDLKTISRLRRLKVLKLEHCKNITGKALLKFIPQSVERLYIKDCSQKEITAMDIRKLENAGIKVFW